MLHIFIPECVCVSVCICICMTWLLLNEASVPSLSLVLLIDSGPCNYCELANIQPILIKVKSDPFDLGNSRYWTQMYFYSTAPEQKLHFVLNHQGWVWNTGLLWNRLESNSKCILLISPSMLCVLCHRQTPIQLHEKKKKKKSGPFLFAPFSSCLGLCYRAPLDPELTHCLNALSERVLSSFPVSVQD